MSRTKFILLAAISIAMVFNSCGEVSDDGSGSSRSSSSATPGGTVQAPSQLCTEVKNCAGVFNIYTHFCSSYNGKSYVCEKCSDEQYDLGREFCSENKIYLLCDGKNYDPVQQFCFRDASNPAIQEVRTRCSGKELDPYREFCFDGEVVPRCGVDIYNPDEEFCLGGKVITKCNGNEFYDDEKFCFNTKLYPFCNSLLQKYNPLTHFCCGGVEVLFADNFCFADIVTPQCGGKTYNPVYEFCGGELGDQQIYEKCGGEAFLPLDEFCFENKIYTKCSGEIYKPDEAACANGVLSLRCGGKQYNDSTKFCFDSKIIDKCRDKSSGLSIRYNPLEQFCSSRGVLEDLCGDQTYNPDTQDCYGGIEVYDKCINSSGIEIPYDPTVFYCYNGDATYSKNCSAGLFCKGGRNYNLCGRAMFDIAESFCDNNSDIVGKCGGVEYDTKEKFCATINGSKEPWEFCQVANPPDDFGRITYTPTQYSPDFEKCPSNKIEPRSDNLQKCVESSDGLSYISPDDGSLKPKANYFCCFGQPYLKSGNTFCHQETQKLFTRCGISYDATLGNDSPYDPIKEICYNGTLKPICLPTEGLTGPCVHSENGLMRCKQLGNGANYIIDPLPGMQCQSNGAIVGIIAGAGSIAQIGEQIWMRDNLGSSTSLPYGYLYNWAAAMDLPYFPNLPDCNSTSQDPCPPPHENLWRGLCPENFHIPTQEDWQKLVEYAGGAGVAAGRLKDASWTGGDDYGFRALPGGYEVNLSGVKSPQGQGFSSIWWTYDPMLGNNAYYFEMRSDDSEVRTYYRPKNHGAYVRCVRNAAF